MASVMRLPDFLGIGAQRSGSTWLHEQLATHPGIYLPPHRKEVGFFRGEKFRRGVEWYSKYFEGARDDQVVGEITPWYFESAGVAQRIHNTLPDCRFLLVLRNPVDRVFSQYTRGFRDRGENRSFQQFLEEQPGAIKKTLYAAQLRQYLRYFTREQFLILVSERMWSEPGRVFQRIGKFLDVDPNGFDIRADANRNASHQVWFPQSYSTLRRLGRGMRDRGHDWLVEGVKRVGVPRLFRLGRDTLPRLQLDTREQLWRVFEEEVAELASLTGLDLSSWRPSSASEGMTAELE